MMCVDTMLLELVDNGLLRPEKINVTVPLSEVSIALCRTNS